jgi:hypothetical protein
MEMKAQPIGIYGTQQSQLYRESLEPWVHILKRQISNT